MIELGGIPARFAGWVLDLPRWKFLTALFVIMFFKTGVTFVAPALALVAKDPYHNPYTNPFEHYLFWSWLGPWLAHLVGATSSFKFTMFYFVFSVGFMVLMTRWIFTRLPEPQARVAMLIFMLLPGSATSFYWVFTDSLTLFLIACTLYFPRTYVVVFLLGVLLGMQHAEQAFVGAGAAFFALAWTARRGGKPGLFDWRWALALLVGVVAGRLLLMFIFYQLDIHLNSGRWYWVAKAWRMLVRRFLFSYHFAIFSAFGVGWLVVIAFLRRKSPEVLPVAVALGGLLLLMPISDDPTRVYAIVSFPLLCAVVLSNGEWLASLRRETIGLLALLWVLVPWMFVWAGKPIVSAAAYDVYWALKHLFGMTDVPRDPRFPV